jgi:hypothetical protein
MSVKARCMGRYIGCDLEFGALGGSWKLHAKLLNPEFMK